MPFPLIKLAALFVKQISKPISNSIKNKAKSSPTFRKICMAPADWYHIFDINIRMRLLGFGKPTEKRKLRPEKAVELGAEMIGEAFLYVTLGAVIFYEYNSTQKSNKKEKEKHEQYLQSLENKIIELELTNAQTEAQLREFSRSLGNLESKNYRLMQKVFPTDKKS